GGVVGRLGVGVPVALAGGEAEHRGGVGGGVGQAVDPLARRQSLLGVLEPAGALLEPVPDGEEHRGRCDPHRRYLPTMPVELMSRSSIWSTVVMSRADAS